MCVLTAQPCICWFAVCVVMCVTGHQSWLDPCTAAGESAGCQVALWERKTQRGSDGVRCTPGCVCERACKWVNVQSRWVILVVVESDSWLIHLLEWDKMTPSTTDQRKHTTTTRALIHILFLSLTYLKSCKPPRFLQMYSILISVPYFLFLICLIHYPAAVWLIPLTVCVSVIFYISLCQEKMSLQS